MAVADRLDNLKDASAVQIAESLRGAGIDYALTGDAGANRYRSSAGEAWPVLYVEDVARAAEAASLARKEPGPFGLRVTLIPFDGVSEVGRVEIAGIAVVARDQVVIDAYGGIDRMPEQADTLLGKPVERSRMVGLFRINLIRSSTWRSGTRFLSEPLSSTGT